MTLRLVPPSPAACCMPWHARAFCDGPVRGADCCFCHRAIAAPEASSARIFACIYCGLDRGLIPQMEVEP